jgi:hypothetical protein
VLPLELSLEVLEKGVIKVLSSQVGVTSGSLDGEDTSGDGEKGDIESTTTEIEDENGALLLVLVVGGIETVGDGGSGRLVDDTENIETSDGTGILGGKTLRVVEVGRYGDNSLLDGLANLEARRKNSSTRATHCLLTARGLPWPQRSP